MNYGKFTQEIPEGTAGLISGDISGRIPIQIHCGISGETPREVSGQILRKIIKGTFEGFQEEYMYVEIYGKSPETTSQRILDEFSDGTFLVYLKDYL